MTKLFTISLFIFTTLLLKAQDESLELIGDRPDMTESAYTITKGHLQFESGVDISKDAIDETTLTYNSSLLRYGLNNKAELRLGVELYKTFWGDYSKNLVPIYLGTKIRLVEKNGKIPQIALIVATGAELQKAGIRSILELTPGAIFTFENSLTDNISIGYNLGIEYSNLAQEITGILSASLGIGMGEHSGVYVEAAWFPAPQTNDARFNAGITHQFSAKFQADIYGGLGLLTDSPFFNAGAGVIFLF
ncbi:MAG: transporter [Prolixibacteraceae bacterium]